MSETTIYFLIILNLVIIVGLTAYILRKLQHQKQKRKEAEQKLEKMAMEVSQRRQHIVESLQVIGQAILNGEIPLTEAGIRCKVLLDNLDVQLGQTEPYIVFNEVFERSKHIPRLEAWKALKGPQKLKYMDEMESLESDYEQQIIEAAKALKEHDFTRYN